MSSEIGPWRVDTWDAWSRGICDRWDAGMRLRAWVCLDKASGAIEWRTYSPGGAIGVVGTAPAALAACIAADAALGLAPAMLPRTDLLEALEAAARAGEPEPAAAVLADWYEETTGRRGEWLIARGVVYRDGMAFAGGAQ